MKVGIVKLTKRETLEYTARPLQHHYARILPVCTWDCIKTVICHENHVLQRYIPKAEIAKCHAQQLQHLTWDVVTRQAHVMDQGDLSYYLSLLFLSEPSLPGMKAGFSSSMEFSMKVLKEVANHSDTILPVAVTATLLTPLLRRLRRRNVGLQHVENALDLAISYYQTHEKGREDDKHDVIRYTVKYWCAHSAMFEPKLRSLLEMYRFHPAKAHKTGSYMYDLSHHLPIFNSVRKPVQYELLRLFCRYARGSGYNIDSDQDLPVIPISTWPVSFFLNVETECGVSLLQRLITLNPRGDFLKLQPLDKNPYVYQTIFSHPSERGARYGDPRLLLTYLNGAAANSAANTEAYVTAARKRAATSSDPEDRAFFAVSAAFYAIASGSLDLYSNTIKWMRRFTGDYKVVKTVYKADVSLTIEGVALLSGLPSNLHECELVDIRENVLKGNDILLEFLDSATAALREPAFNASDWRGALSLFAAVTKSRMDQAAKLSERFQLSDEEHYDILWAPTLKTLVADERIGLASEHAKLEFDTPLGPLADFNIPLFASPYSRYLTARYITQSPVNPPWASSYRFVDDLARSRDELWKELRPTWNPAVAALGPPFPRGLPIQTLTGPYIVATENAASHIPYLTARAKQIVMIEPSLALNEPPTDEETQLAIGHFVDSYTAALDIYIQQRGPRPDRNEALAAVTRHAIRQLSGCLRPDEVERFWCPIFGRLGLPLEDISCKTESQQSYPAIPTDIDSREATEWHPQSAIPKGCQARKLQPTVLDWMLWLSPSGKDKGDAA